MTSSSTDNRSHHLPSKQQNIFYICVLIASPLINLSVRSLVQIDSNHATDQANPIAAIVNHILVASGFLLGAILVLLGINIAQALMLRHRKARRSLLIFGILSSSYLLTNLLTICYGIYAFKIQSYLLLVISACIYASVNIIFLFWYWYIDFPTQIRRLRHPESDVELEFPRPKQPTHAWLPDFFDYLYFTVMASNTLGPPENHSPNGRAIKTVLLLHSVTMLILLVIFVSRAINTLS